MDVERDERNRQNRAKDDVYGTYYFTKKQKRRRPYADSRGGY